MPIFDFEDEEPEEEEIIVEPEPDEIKLLSKVIQRDLKYANRIKNMAEIADLSLFRRKYEDTKEALDSIYEHASWLVRDLETVLDKLEWIYRKRYKIPIEEFYEE
jgi:hypothetical protein